MTAARDLPFVGTGGETGARIAAHDWSGTCLGPLRSWSPALRTAVGIMLETVRPALIWWGPDLTLLYNDAFVPLARDRHPAALGGPGAQVLGDVWPQVGPVVHRVMDGGAAVEGATLPLPDDRQAHHTFSCTPVRDDDGRVRGVFAVVDTAAARQVPQAAGTHTRHAPALGWVADAEGRFEHVNEAWLEFTGASAESQLGDGWQRWVHPDDLAHHLERTAAARDLGRGWESEYRLRRADGRHRRLLEHAVPVEGGTWVGSAVDISERHRRTHGQLFQERERYRILVSQAPVGIWTADSTGATTFVNEHVAQLAGRGTEEFAVAEWGEYIHPDDRAEAAASWAAAVRAGTEWEHGYRIVRPDGSVRDVVSSARPLRDAEGTVTGYLGTTIDVTQERRAEHVRREVAAEHAARRVSDAAAARLGAMVQGLAAIVWEADWEPDRRALRFTFVSDRAEELLGHPARRWREDPDFWPEVIHPDDRARVLDLITDRTTAGLDHDLTYRAVSVDGRVVWLHQVVHVVCGPGGEPERAQGLTVDVTEQKRAERSAAVLAETGRLVSGTGTAEQRLAALARLVVHDLGDGAVVSLMGADGLVRRVAVAHDDPEVERALIRLAPSRLPPALTETFSSGRPVLVPVTDELSRSAARDESDAAARVGLGATSTLVVPLVVSGTVVGLLGFVNFGPRHYDRTDLDLAEELGRRASLMLAADRQRARERHMQQVSADLASAGSVAEAAQRLVARLTDVLGAGAMSVYLVEPDRGIRLVHAAGYSTEMLDTFAVIRLDDPVPIAAVVRTGEPIWIRNRADWERQWPALLEHAVAADRHAAATLPLVAAGRVVGTIGISFPTERAFPADERDFVSALVTQAASAFERAATADERRMIAETLQTSLLPPTLPELEGLALAARYLPGAQGTQAGGDWYDVLALDGGLIAIAVGDVVGQGAPAAAIMGQLRSVLSGYLLEGHGPVEALERLDRFAARVPGATGSTVTCLVLDPATGELVWASAGHLPPLVTGRGGARSLNGAAGTVLVVRGRPPFTAGHDRITPGDTVVLYTDGLVERRGEVVDDGLDRLAAAAAAHHDLGPRALTEALLTASLDGAAATGPTDDVALIAARLMPAPLRLELPALAPQLRRLRSEVLGWAAAAGLGEDDTYDLQLAIGEAAANAVEHAYRDRPPGTMAVELVREPGGTVQALVSDTGHWRPAPADKGYRGRGLDLIRDVSARMRLDHGDGGTRVRFALVPPARAASDPGRETLVATGPTGPASLRVIDTPGPLRVEVLGDLDLAGVRAVREELVETVRGAREVAVDLRGTAYLASAGVALLVEARQVAQAAGGRLRLLVAPGGIVRRALALSGVDAVVDVVDASEEPPQTPGN